jgi:hypothetical protein
MQEQTFKAICTLRDGGDMKNSGGTVPEDMKMAGPRDAAPPSKWFSDV